MENWDQFEPFKTVEKKPFLFQTNRFEVWAKGEMINSGNSTALLSASSNYLDGSTKMIITFNQDTFITELVDEVCFDEFVSSNDRLKLVTIPKETHRENLGLLNLRMVYGSTRPYKNFTPKEPYCCNLFFLDGKLSKVTFSFSFPEKLLEMY